MQKIKFLWSNTLIEGVIIGQYTANSILGLTTIVHDINSTGAEYVLMGKCELGKCGPFNVLSIDPEPEFMKMHNGELNEYKRLGHEEYFKKVWNNPDLEIGLAYIHPEDNLRGLHKFKQIQEAYINAIV